MEFFALLGGVCLICATIIIIYLGVDLIKKGEYTTKSFLKGISFSVCGILFLSSIPLGIVAAEKFKVPELVMILIIWTIIGTVWFQVNRLTTK